MKEQKIVATAADGRKFQLTVLSTLVVVEGISHYRPEFVVCETGEEAIYLGNARYRISLPGGYAIEATDDRTSPPYGGSEPHHGS